MHRFFQGTHDFTQFSNNSESGRKRNPIKTLYRVDLVPLQGGLRIEYEGSGFLYKMVRQLTGACLAVGLGKLQPGFIKDQLDLGSSRTPGMTTLSYACATPRHLALAR